jgi:hypothetical protein
LRQSKAANRPSLDRIDGQRAAVDAPTGPRAQVLVVVAQMPHEIGDSSLAGAVGDRPVVGDAGYPAQRVVRLVAWGVDLADDRVLGAGHRGERGHGGPHTVAAVVAAHRLQRARRVGQAQFGCLSEQFGDVVESAVVNGRGVQVHQVGHGQPVGGGELHAVSPNR